jgi:hypothetical protein
MVVHVLVGIMFRACARSGHTHRREVHAVRHIAKQCHFRQTATETKPVGGGRVVIAAFGVELIQREAVGMVVHVLVGIMFPARQSKSLQQSGGGGDQFTICRYNLRHASPVTCLDLKHITVAQQQQQQQ